MTNRTDDKLLALQTLLSSSDLNIDTLENEWLLSVITVPVSAHINDLWYELWVQEGVTATSYNNMAYEWLGTLGYTGALPDRWAAYWAAGGGGGGGFLPTDLVGLFNWVEVGDIGDFYQDELQATPVTATDDPVGTWADKSGGDNHFVQSSAALKMIYKDTYVDQSGDYLVAPLTTPDVCMVGMRFTHKDASATTGVFQIASAASSGAAKMLLQTNATTFRIFIVSGYIVTETIAIDTDYTVIVRISKPASLYLVDYWINGVKGTQVSLGGAWSGVSSGLYLGNGFSHSGAQRYEGLVFAEGAFTDEEAENLSTYLEAL